MKTYTIQELKENREVVVFLENKEEYEKLKNTKALKMTSKFFGDYCYNLVKGTYSTDSTKTKVGAYYDCQIIEFSQIDFQEAPEDTLKNIIIW